MGNGKNAKLERMHEKFQDRDQTINYLDACFKGRSICRVDKVGLTDRLSKLNKGFDNMVTCSL